MNVVVRRIHGETSCRENGTSIGWSRLGHVVLVQRRPGAQVVPSEVRRQAEDARLGFSFSRAGFENRVIDADIFTLGIELPKSAREPPRAIVGGNLFQPCSRLRKMFAQR